ncbi:MAG: hypothetical protein ACK55Z_27435, partial [bacterium]
SYDIPQASTSRLSNSAKTGSQLHTIIGSNYGASESPCVRLGTSSAETTSWRSHTSTLCSSAASFGASRQAIVTAGLQSGSSSEIMSYLSANLQTYLSPRDAASIAANMPRRVGNISASVLLSGANMGLFAKSSAVRVGGSSSESTVWKSESCLLGKLVGGNFRS